MALFLSILIATRHTSEEVSVDYWKVLEHKTEVDKKKLFAEPESPELMESVATDLWLVRKWDEAYPLLEKARNSYSLRKNENSTAFETASLRLADLCVDKGDFSKARDLYKEMSEYDSRYGADSSQRARDLNNIGLCSFLFAKTKPSPEERTKLLADALMNLHQAQQNFEHQHLEAQLTSCLENQSAVLSLMGRRDEARRLHSMVQNRLADAHAPNS